MPIAPWKILDSYNLHKNLRFGCVSPNTASRTNLIYSFLALNAEKAAAQDLDDTEEIEVELMPLEDVIAMARHSELLQSMQVSDLFFALSYLDRIH
jgi:hypothetical protein